MRTLLISVPLTPEMEDVVDEYQILEMQEEPRNQDQLNGLGDVLGTYLNQSLHDGSCTIYAVMIPAVT